MTSSQSEDAALQQQLATGELHSICESPDTPDMARVAELVAGGANLDKIDAFEFGLLHLAVRNHHAELVRYLVGKGAKTEYPLGHNYHSTPLLYATWGAHNTEMAKLLVNLGSSLSAKDAIGDTPLHNAALKKDIEFLRHVLEGRADIDTTIRNKSKSNVLERATTMGAVEFVDTLIAHGWPIDEVSVAKTSNAAVGSSIGQCHERMMEALREGFNRWKTFFNERQADVTTLTREDICSLANAQLHLDVFTPDLWRGHTKELNALLADLPPWLAQDIIVQQSALSSPQHRLLSGTWQHSGTITPTEPGRTKE